jgi:hypothetical protein
MALAIIGGRFDQPLNLSLGQMLAAADFTIGPLAGRFILNCAEIVLGRTSRKLGFFIDLSAFVSTSAPKINIVGAGDNIKKYQLCGLTLTWAPTHHGHLTMVWRQ